MRASCMLIALCIQMQPISRSASINNQGGSQGGKGAATLCARSAPGQMSPASPLDPPDTLFVRSDASHATLTTFWLG